LRHIVILLATVVVGCGGASASDLFSTSGGSSESSSGASSSGASGNSNGGVPPTDPGMPTPCEAKTWYRDRDGDGVGGSETQVACLAPSKEYVAKGGDCEDENGDVFPGQTAYFTTPYASSQGRASYDYDCDGKEEQHPPPRTRGGTCMPSGVTMGCVGSGFIPLSARAGGTGVDLLCGPVKRRECNAVGTPGNFQCVATDTAAEPTQCQ
jgi:hypothetical protein